MTKPNAIKVKPARFQAKSVRSAAKNTRGSFNSDMDGFSHAHGGRCDYLASYDMRAPTAMTRKSRAGRQVLGLTLIPEASALG
jgi:hypothetical protein